MSKELVKMGEAIENALENCPINDVLSVLTGAFVGLVVELVRRNGQDTNKQITIDGGSTSRNITIHPPKNTEVHE